MPTELRHVQFSERPEEMRRQLTDNAVDTDQALAQKVSGHTVFVSAYMATGATTSKIPLPSESITPTMITPSLPVGVILIRAYPTNDPGADTPTTGRVNFSQQGESLFVFEPAGLVQNRLYDLTFLVIEGE